MGDLKFARSTLDATRSQDHGGNIYRAREIAGKDILDFSANINPLGLPSHLKNAIRGNLWSILHYPDPDAKDLTRTIAQYWKIPEENVLVGNGSTELIYLIAQTLRPRRVLIPAPTFSEYERSVRTVGARVRFIGLRESEGFRLKLNRRLKMESSIFLCNPNNPTGNLILEHPETIEELADKLLVIDEAFMDFLPDQKNYTLIWKATESKKIIVVRSFTKFFALPGLRLGYLVAHKEIIDKLKQHLPPWNTNSLAQMAAELILDDKEYIKNTHKLIEKERKFLLEQLAKIEGLKPHPSVTNFLLIKIEMPGMTSKSLKELLIKTGILIRDCSNFRNLNDKYIRIAVRSHKENLKLLTSLKTVITA